MTITESERPARAPRIVAEPFPPEHPMLLDWWKAGFKRQNEAIIGALVAAWTGLPFALWLAAVGFFVGAVIGFLGVTVHSSSLGIFGTIVGSPGGGLLGALVGAVLGAVGGFLLIYYFLVTHPLQLAGALVGGAIVSIAVFVAMEMAEPHLMRLRGYRKPSRREQEKLSPLLVEVGSLMNLELVPEYWISESKKPGAWMHLRAIVLTRGLLGDYDDSEDPPKPDLDDPALGSILAHELNHWKQGDVVGLTMISACFLPFVCIVNAIKWIRLRAEWTGVILWCFFWPVWLSSRFLVVPLMAYWSRLYEFQADHAAAKLGSKYRLGMRRALTELANWEVPRTGWEEVLAATHPPTELRLERLEEYAVDTDPDLFEDETKPETPGTRPRRPPGQRARVAKPPARTQASTTPVVSGSAPDLTATDPSSTARGARSKSRKGIGLEDDDDTDARWSPHKPG